MTVTTVSPDYSAVRDGGAGVIDLSARGRLLVNGSEAVMFLNGLITNDMKTLAVNSWMPAVFPNVQGRLLAAVRIIHGEDGFLIDTEAATRATVMTILERFTLAGDFRLTDLTTETAMLSVQGNDAAKVLLKTLAETALNRQGVVTAQMEHGAKVTIIRATHTAEDGFDLIVDRNEGPALHNSLTKSGAQTIDADTLEVLRIEAGIPSYGVDMDETNVVTETNLDDAVSFTKGCYIGQEIIARIKYRGHVAKKLSGLVFEKAAGPEAAAKVLSTDDKEIGRLTSTTYSPRLNRMVALAYLKYDYLAPGTSVKVAFAKQELPATVSELPFVRGSWYVD